MIPVPILREHAVVLSLAWFSVKTPSEAPLACFLTVQWPVAKWQCIMSKFAPARIPSPNEFMTSHATFEYRYMIHVLVFRFIDRAHCFKYSDR